LLKTIFLVEYGSRRFRFLPTSPFSTPEHIRVAAKAINSQGCESVVGVMRTGKYLNNLRVLRSNNLEPLVEFSELNAQRQGQEELLFVNGAIFFAKPGSLLTQKKLFTSSHVLQLRWITTVLWILIQRKILRALSKRYRRGR